MLRILTSVLNSQVLNDFLSLNEMPKYLLNIIILNMNLFNKINVTKKKLLKSLTMPDLFTLNKMVD